MLPLLVAGVVWILGYVYVYKIIAFGLCALKDFNCTPLATHIGHPALQLAHWLLPIALIVLFAPIRFLKRWLVFAGIYFVLSVYAISQTSVSPFLGKEGIAYYSGEFLLAITVVWLLVHLILSRRKSTKSP